MAFFSWASRAEADCANAYDAILGAVVREDQPRPRPQERTGATPTHPLLHQRSLEHGKARSEAETSRTIAQGVPAAMVEIWRRSSSRPAPRAIPTDGSNARRPPSLDCRQGPRSVQTSRQRKGNGAMREPHPGKGKTLVVTFPQVISEGSIPRRGWVDGRRRHKGILRPGGEETAEGERWKPHFNEGKKRFW